MLPDFGLQTTVEDHRSNEPGKVVHTNNLTVLSQNKALKRLRDLSIRLKKLHFWRKRRQLASYFK